MPHSGDLFLWLWPVTYYCDLLVWLTCLGFSCVVLSPCPSLPYSPNPHVYRSPLDVMAALCELPQAMSRTRLDFRASISRGLSQFHRLKWPSFPSSPSPHENTFPSVVKAKECRPPFQHQRKQNIKSNKSCFNLPFQSLNFSQVYTALTLLHFKLQL
jgi:hypothetical protein